MDGAADQQQCTADRRDQGGRRSREKTNQDSRQYCEGKCESETIRLGIEVNGYLLRGGAAVRVQPVQHEPINEQPDDGDRPQSGKKVAIPNARYRSDQNILRITGDGCCAADV